MRVRPPSFATPNEPPQTAARFVAPCLYKKDAGVYTASNHSQEIPYMA